MHDEGVQVGHRVDRLLRERLIPAIVQATVPCEVAAFEVPSEPVGVGVALGAQYSPIAPGDPWGPPWSTLWLRIEGAVPEAWASERVELNVDLGFDGRSPGFQAEGLAYDARGVPVKGIEPLSSHVPLSLLGAKGGDSVLLYVEAAANPSIMGGGRSGFLPTKFGRRETAGTDALRRLGRIELVLTDETVRGLCLDIDVLAGLVQELSTGDPRRHDILRALGQMADVVDLDDVAASAPDARRALSGVLSSPATASAHRVVATGHAHIDSAWLWPIRETVRKCARTFANVLALGEQYPELIFSCSQAQQYEWVRDNYPELYERVRERVASGRWVPVGGTWVEPDGNLCGSEALARQLVLGRRFFANELGMECKEVWLPDSFGYSAAWPQLAKLAGAQYFLTQKLSWNQTNKFPHSTFLWEGIDGTRIFTHFPSVATYNSDLSPAELGRASREYAEHGRGTRSLVPFGFGDGGGGPTREMLERAKRQANLEGSPRVELGSSLGFFAAAEAEYPDPPVWSGELYLELHRGTYTSQARIKRGNRHCEHLLREAELWSTSALVEGLLDYPFAELEQAWKTLLLLQFHDILPGSSIGWVNDEAVATYDELARTLEAIVERATSALTGTGVLEMELNAGPLPRDGVPALGAAPAHGRTGNSLPAPVSVGSGADEGSIVLDNGLVRAVLDRDGLIASVWDHVADREVLPPGGRANLLQLHRDLPNQWDAWDVDAFYRNSVDDLIECESVEVIAASDEEAVVEVRRRFGAGRGSSAVQRVRLVRGGRRVELETDVEWREHDKLLKVAFPMDLRAEHSSAEIQYGHVRRPLEVNTSWDAARFEVCAHRWVHVGETGYGVALANDATYGHDFSRTTRSDGGTTTTVRLSLVRGPGFPDPAADSGLHRFAYVLAPGAALRDAVAEGYRANLPLRRATGARVPAPSVTVDDGGSAAVIVEAVKAADDRSGDVVVRMYEALGGRARATVTPAFAASAAVEADLLERALPDRPGLPLSDGSFVVELRPFQILTIVVRRGATAGF